MRKQFEETVEDLMAQNEHFVLLLGDIGIFGFRNAFRWAQRIYNPGLYRCFCVMPAPLLDSAKYFVHAFLSRNTDGMPYVHIPEVMSFQVIDDGTARDNFTTADYPGVIRTLLPWKSEQLAGLPFPGNHLFFD